jgi:hypothetical protein
MIREAAPHGRTAPGLTGSRFGVWVLVGVALLLAPAVASAQFSVYPVAVKLESTDRVSTASFIVENSGATPLEVTIYLSDYDRAVDGGHGYFDFGSHEGTCAGRLEAFPDQVSVQPGRDAEVRLRLAPGSETCWAVVFVEQRSLTPSGITVAQRIGVKVHSERPALEREGAVVGLAADSTPDPAVFLTFENQGEGALDLRGEVEVRGLAGEVLAVVAVRPFEVLPGRRRTVRVSLEEANLEPGRYVVVGILDFGGEYLAGGQALIEVRP